MGSTSNDTRGAPSQAQGTGEDATEKASVAQPSLPVDDFGLPIRQFATSPTQAVTGDEAPPARAAEAEATGSESKPLENPASTPKPAERSLTPSSDTEVFQDAKESAPPSDEQKQPTPTAPRMPDPSSDQGEPSDSAKPDGGAKGEMAEAQVEQKTPATADETPGPSSTPAKPTQEASEATATTHADPPTSTQATKPVEVGHKREISVASTVDGTGVSEFSHQQLPQPSDGAGDDGDWQEMPSFARYDMYDDDDRLIAREHHEEEDADPHGYANLGGAGKGYTRVQMDEDAQSATSMDEHTQYLFKEANGTSLTGAEEDEARDAVSQMEATKDLLTEGQRIAYVGVVRLQIADMVQQGEKLERTRRMKQLVTMAAESLKMWGQKMMIRLYAHMDISQAEQVMIEQLAEHGVTAGDLTPALLTNSTVANPMAGKSSSSTQAPPPYAEEKPAEVPPPYEKREGEELPGVKNLSELPTTDKIDIDLRWTVLCDLFLVLIADSAYDARSRVLLEGVGKSMDIPWLDICKFEKRVTDALEMQQQAEKENWNEDEHMESRRKAALKRRYMMMGLATVGGGLVIGLSAGLLAPVIGAGLAAGFTTIGVGGTSSFLAGAGGAAVITSSAAASGSFIGGKAAHRRTGAVRTFEYRPLHNNKRVNLIVTVSGWLTGNVDDVRLPFSTVNSVMGDIYSVLWEPEMLKSMGDTINILATEALTQGLQQILGSTILVSLMAALQLPIVLTKLSYLIDNPWAVSLDRATSAGQILADSLIERSLGTRPITLVGYSLGSRVIFSCLQELGKRGAHGLVQNVYMFGSPIVVKKDEYIRARTVVSGRFVNGFNRNDWILGYLFRLTNGGIRRIAGLAAVEEPWIENIDVTDVVVGHMDYRTAMPTLLMNCGWDVESEEFSEIEDPDPENHQSRQRELINEIEAARKELEKEGKAKKEGKFGFFGRKKRAEKQAWEIYEDSGQANHPDRNHGVLFDVDAIRAELAKEAHDPDAFQIREIESTLPPMKLEIPPASSPSTTPTTPTAASVRRSPIRGSLSTDAIPMRSSQDVPSSASPATTSPLRQQQQTFTNGVRSRSATPSYPAYGGFTEEDDGVQMTFDSAFNDHNDHGVPSSSLSLGESSLGGRPELKTAQTVPNITLSDPWADAEDDEDFGKEKEISMTFA